MTRETMLRIIKDTSVFFLEHMPQAPFTPDDIVIEFFKPSDARATYKRFCSRYFPRKLDGTEYLKPDFFKTMGASALVGVTKSGLFIRSTLQCSEDEFRHIILHELAHIYCIKTEMPADQHFIDIYLGCTTTTEFADAADRQEDGCISAGYEVWREFIADYIAVCLDPKGFEHSLRNSAFYVSDMLIGVKIGAPEAKLHMSLALAALMTASDSANLLTDIDVSGDFGLDRTTMEVFYSILEPVHRKLFDCAGANWLTQADPNNHYPWMIDRDFIELIGARYLMFLIHNSFEDKTVRN